MPRAQAELRGRLRYRSLGPVPRLSLLHVQLSAAAARALRGCEQREEGPGPLIAFQGSQERLTVPGGPEMPPQVFIFSCCSWDEPSGSLECVRLAVSRLGQSWLDSLGSIREKITVCAAKSACPPLWEPVFLAKQPCSRAAVEPDPAVLRYGIGVTNPEEANVIGLLHKDTVCHVPKHTEYTPAPASASLQSPVQPRDLWLHCEPEILQRPEGTWAGRPGRAQLPTMLHKHTELEPTACGVKGTMVGQEQKNGPGNMAWEQLQAALLQHRSQDHRSSDPSFVVPLQQPPEHCSPRSATRKLLGVKRLALLDFSDPRASKRSCVPASSPGLQEWHRSCTEMLSMQHLGAQDQQHTEHLPSGSCAVELESLGSKEETGNAWEENACCPEQHLCVLRGLALRAQGEPASPDCSRKYRTICSAEQRRTYEAAFSTDYSEYRCLHACIGNVSQKFIQLGAKMKTLKQGTEERKVLEVRIMCEYSHFKKTYPSYQKEKQHCEYLHEKLSHIKSLILQFERSRSL